MEGKMNDGHIERGSPRRKELRFRGDDRRRSTNDSGGQTRSVVKLAEKTDRDGARSDNARADDDGMST
jgi:hypothetical protein